MAPQVLDARSVAPRCRRRRAGHAGDMRHSPGAPRDATIVFAHHQQQGDTVALSDIDIAQAATLKPILQDRKSVV